MHYQNFETKIMIEMRMTCGYDQFVVFVLDFRKLLCHSMGMAVVDESDGANERRVWFPVRSLTRRSRIKSRKAFDRLVYPCRAIEMSKRRRRSKSWAIPNAA